MLLRGTCEVLMRLNGQTVLLYLSIYPLGLKREVTIHPIFVGLKDLRQTAKGSAVSKRQRMSALLHVKFYIYPLLYVILLCLRVR